MTPAASQVSLSWVRNGGQSDSDHALSDYWGCLQPAGKSNSNQYHCYLCLKDTWLCAGWATSNHSQNQSKCWELFTLRHTCKSAFWKLSLRVLQTSCLKIIVCDYSDHKRTNQLHVPFPASYLAYVTDVREGIDSSFSCQHGLCATIKMQERFESVLWFFIKDLRQSVRALSSGAPLWCRHANTQQEGKVLVLAQEHDAHVTHSSVCVDGTLCSKWARVLSESLCTLVCRGRRSLAAAPFCKAMNIFTGTKTGYENNCSELVAAPEHFSSGSTKQESKAVWLVRF